MFPLPTLTPISILSPGPKKILCNPSQPLLLFLINEAAITCPKSGLGPVPSMCLY